MATPCPVPKMQFIDADGNPLALGKVYSYSAGTLTPKDTYTNAGGGTANANPVILDAAGQADIWLNGSYKLIVKTAADVTISTTDNITSDISTSVTYIATDGTAPTTTPTVNAAATDGLAIGNKAVVASGGLRGVTIGNAYVSGADSVAISNQSDDGTYGAQASGAIAIGKNAKVGTSGTNSVTIGGDTVSVNTATSVAIGGSSNTMSGSGTLNSVMIAGTSNTISGAGGLGAILLGGAGNSITASGHTYNVIIGGATNSISANTRSTILNGDHNSITGGSYGQASGSYAKAYNWGQKVFAPYRFAVVGDCQTSEYCLMAKTTSGTPNIMALDDDLGDQFIFIPTDTTVSFVINIVARRTDADNESAAYRLEGCIDNNAGTTALVGSVTKTVIAEDTAAWDVAATADNTYDYLVITVTGEAAKTIQWVAHVRTVETTG